MDTGSLCYSKYIGFSNGIHQTVSSFGIQIIHLGPVNSFVPIICVLYSISNNLRVISLYIISTPTLNTASPRFFIVCICTVEADNLNAPKSVKIVNAQHSHMKKWSMAVGVPEIWVGKTYPLTTPNFLWKIEFTSLFYASNFLLHLYLNRGKGPFCSQPGKRGLESCGLS